MEDKDDDPFDYDTERLVKELCTENRSWKPSQSDKCPDRALLETKLRESEADGEFLIWESEESQSFKEVYDQLGITKVPHKRFIRQAAQQFRKRSQKFKEKLAELRESEPGEDESPVKLRTATQATPAIITPAINTPEPPQKRRRIAPTQLSEKPMHSQPVRILTEADAIKQPKGLNNKPETTAAGGLLIRRDAPHHRYYSATPITSSQFEPDMDDEDGKDFQFRAGMYEKLPGHCLAISRGMQRYLGVSSRTEAALPQDEEHPLFGESGSEAGYDSDTMREIEAEQTERAQLHQKSQSDRSVDVAQELRSMLLDMEEQWRAEKFPKLVSKANKIWNEARSRQKSRIKMIEKARITSQQMQARLAKMCTHVEEDPNFRPSDVVTIRQAFETTVYEKLEAEWRADLLAQTSEPERGVTKPVTICRRKVPCVEFENGLEGEVLYSDTDPESPNGFIVEESLDGVLEESAKESKADLAPSPIDLTDDTPRKPRQNSSPSELSEVEPSPSKKRKLRRNKAAQDMRDLDRRRMEEQEKRSRQLRAQLANSDMSGFQSRLIINEAKKSSQGFVYVPDQIAKYIKDHQIEGVRFMWNQVVADRSQGCLLAHTMGLGKTVQVICLLVAIQEASQSADASVVSQIPKEIRRSQTLVLCPPGLLNNWLDEFARWVVPYEMLGKIYKVDADVPAEARVAFIEPWVRSGGVLLMGYSLFRGLVNSDDDQVQAWLTETPTIVIADEAHTIKNEASKISESMANFKAKAKIAMTGSPLANSVGDYFSMINWVAPNYLGPRKEFSHFFATPIQDGLFVDSSPNEKRRAMKLLKALKDTVSPKVHRMTTTALKGQLPEKREYVIMVPLTEYQKRTYEIYMRWVATRGDDTAVSLLGYICQLSMLLAHPRIFLQYFSEIASEIDKDVKKRSRESKIPRHIIGTLIAEVNRRDIHNLNHSYKITVLTEILNQAKRVGDKVLIFSSRLPVLDFLENLMKMQKRSYSRLDGETKISTRQASVANFNTNNDEVYLISTTAGGVGLNIQGASRVVIMDFQWQPANEQQAIGRAYRIGQTKPVYVYWLIVGGTYEPKLHAAAIFKTQLASRVVDKKNPNPHASKVKTWMQPPEIAKREESTLIKAKGSDPEVLDHILESPTASQICKIMIGDIFEQEEPDHQLSPEELKEAVDLVKMNQLRITDPEAYGRLIQLQPGPVNLDLHAAMTLNPQQISGLREQSGHGTLQAPLQAPKSPLKIILHISKHNSWASPTTLQGEGSAYPLAIANANPELVRERTSLPNTEGVNTQLLPIPGAGTFTKIQKKGSSETGALRGSLASQFIDMAKDKIWGEMDNDDLFKLAGQVQAALEAKSLSGLPAVRSLRHLIGAFDDSAVLELVLAGQLEINRLVNARGEEFEAQFAKVKQEVQLPANTDQRLASIAVLDSAASKTGGRGSASTKSSLNSDPKPVVHMPNKISASPIPVPPMTGNITPSLQNTDAARGITHGPQTQGSEDQNVVRANQSSLENSTKQSRPNGAGLKPHAQTPSQPTQEISERRAKKKKKKKKPKLLKEEREPRLPQWGHNISRGMASEPTTGDTSSSVPLNSRVGDSMDTPLFLDDD